MQTALSLLLVELSLVLGLSLASGTAAFAQAIPDKHVLVLYSTRRDAEIVTVGERELPRLLEAGVGGYVDYYSEYIDRARFPDPDYKGAFRDFLKTKYEGQRFDVVIAMQDVALEFLGDNRDALFVDSPIVFVASEPGTRRATNSTGLFTTLDFRSSLALATVLQPDARNVFVVSGTGVGDEIFREVAREQFRPFEARLTFTYLSDLSKPALEARLSSLPPLSLVFYLVMNRDGDGEAVQPIEYVNRLTAVSNAPVYSWVDSTIGRGVVGGSMRSQLSVTRALGELAVRVLKGERAEDIAPSAPDLSVPQVDWRQLQRFGLRESRVPAGTRILFKDSSVWDRYRIQIIASFALVFAQSALIVGLLVQRARRRRAEAQVRRNELELRTSYERIRDLGGRLLKEQETERSRIARELHDDVSQQLALLSVDLETLAASSDGESEELTMEVIGRTRSIAKSVHDLSHRLHPARLRLIGLVPALTALQNEVAQQGIPVVFTHADVPSPLPADVTLCVYRIVQEALQNAMKYSHAQSVTVHLCGDRAGLALTIADDGVGFDVAKGWGRGLGLVSMSERLEAIGGSLAVRSAPGTGTRLDARVPVREGMLPRDGAAVGAAAGVPIPHSSGTGRPIA